MAKPWYIRDPDGLQALLDRLELIQPGLRAEWRDGAFHLTGEFLVAAGEAVHARYNIDIAVAPESERHLPVVLETGKAIPWVPDRHIEADGKACVVLPDAFWYENPQGMHLGDFIEGPLRSFFASQALVDLGLPGAWPDGEWAHGNTGITDFYEAILGTSEPDRVISLLRALQRRRPQGRLPCPCGSGRKLRDCHMNLVVDLRSRIPPAVAAKTEQRLLQGIRR